MAVLTAVGSVVGTWPLKLRRGSDQCQNGKILHQNFVDCSYNNSDGFHSKDLYGYARDKFNNTRHEKVFVWHRKLYVYIEQCISFIFLHASKNLISKMAVLSKPPANYVRNFPAPGDPNLKDLRISVRPGGWRKCFHLLQLFAGFNPQTLW